MFDIYKSIKDLSLDNISPSFMDQFAAWACLNKVEKLDNKMKQAFLDEVMGRGGDSLVDTFESEEKVDDIFNFMMEDFDYVIYRKKGYSILDEEVDLFFSEYPKEELLEKVNVDLDPGQVCFYLTDVGGEKVKFFDFKKSGPILIADINMVDRSKVEIDMADFFKSLADDQRISMIARLSKGPMTKKDLAEACDISPDEVAKNLELLIKEQLVFPESESGGRLADSYRLNKMVLKEKLDKAIRKFCQ